MKKRLAYLAVGTVAIAGMTGAFGQVAFATEGGEAPVSGAAFDAYAQKLLSSDSIQAVGQGANGPIVYTTEAVDQIEPDARFLVESKSNVTVKVLDGPLTAYDADEVVGGAGYFASENEGETSGGLCSVGFSGWSPDGEPAVISAGHCTGDDSLDVSNLTLPTGDPAGGGATDNSDVQIIQGLGELAFSQFGGPGNTPGSQSTDSVDISVIDVTNDDLTLLPEVTDWKTADSEDLAASTITVGSVGSAVLGESVVKSGRTTGFTDGTVDSIEGWANVTDAEGNNPRLVYGFGNLLTAAPGDSGGALMQGDTAVGVLSAGGKINGQDFVWGANLEEGLDRTGGYTVALHINAPALTSPADGGEVYTGRAISGTAPEGTKVVVTQGSNDPFEVDAADGTWTFNAPAEAGDYSYTIRAERGFDSSESSSFDVTVVPAPLEAPVFTAPGDGQSIVTSVDTITGTGTPGATVTLSGDVEETVKVAANGTWSVDVELGYGSYTVKAVQTSTDASPSPAATLTFSVVPVAPVITDPKSGLGYDLGSGPTSVSGTGITGATVTLQINGNPAGSTVVKNGKWQIGLTAQLAAGTVSITATQTIDGATSAVATSTITVTAVDNGGTTPTPAPAPAPAGNGDNGSLANTGAAVAPLAGGGIALLLAAGALLLVARRTNAARRAE